MKIVIISNNAPSLLNFRGALINTLVKRGHMLVTLGPDAGFESELAAIGAEYRQIPLQRTGTNPAKDMVTVYALTKLLRKMHPDIVLSYSIKPIIYGSLAASFATISDVYSMITGLGYIFTGDRARQRILYRLVYPLYKLALSKNRVVFFLNPDDLKLFRRLKLVNSNTKQVLLNGEGVNLSDFAYSPPPTEPVSFLLIARLIWDKGIGEYVESARYLKSRYPEVSFKLVGPFDSNPAAIKSADVERWGKEGIIEYLGETKDVRPYLASASVYVLPSYREGTPRSVLEAMSMGRPIITTDAPGCRETLRDGVNGFLVPAKDVAALEKAMERFILNPELIPEFGLASRRIAEERYDVHKVNQVIMEAMGL